MGAIRDALAGITDLKEVSRIRAQGILDSFQALPAGQRASFTYDGMTVTFLAVPKLIRDRQNRVIGLEVIARGRVGGVFLPRSDSTHRVINPPTSIPDGTFTTQVIDGVSTQVPNYVEDPIQAMKIWLVESLRVEARAAGWGG